LIFFRICSITKQIISEASYHRIRTLNNIGLQHYRIFASIVISKALSIRSIPSKRILESFITYRGYNSLLQLWFMKPLFATNSLSSSYWSFWNESCITNLFIDQFCIRQSFSFIPWSSDWVPSSFVLSFINSWVLFRGISRACPNTYRIVSMVWKQR